MREEAKERDHRKLGKELDLFMVSKLVQGYLSGYQKAQPFVVQLNVILWTKKLA